MSGLVESLHFSQHVSIKLAKYIKKHLSLTFPDFSPR